jgi:hypothetical protein
VKLFAPLIGAPGACLLLGEDVRLAFVHERRAIEVVVGRQLVVADPHHREIALRLRIGQLPVVIGVGFLPHGLAFGVGRRQGRWTGTGRRGHRGDRDPSSHETSFF